MTTSSPQFASTLLVSLAAACILSGCGGSSTPSSTTTTGTTGTSASAVYVIQEGTGAAGSLPQVLQFTAGANGAASPTSSLTLPSTAYIDSVAVDSGGQIYVGADLPSGEVIEVFAAGSTGAATPARTIKLPGIYEPLGLALDASGQLYVVDTNAEVLVYSSSANGSAVPVRTISGALTTLGYGVDVAVDASGAIYVATAVLTSTSVTGEIQVFAPGASGNVAPQRVITSNNVFLGVTVDSGSNLYASVDVASVGGTSSVVQYSATATGAATPARSIAGSATQLATAGAVRVDGAGNLYVANQVGTGSTYTYALEKFAASASGNTAPAAALTSSSWTDAAPQIAIR